MQLSGVLMNGRTRCSHLEYWVRGPFEKRGIAPGLDDPKNLKDDDEELLAGPWAPPPTSLNHLRLMTEFYRTYLRYSLSAG